MEKANNLWVSKHSCGLDSEVRGEAHMCRFSLSNCLLGVSRVKHGRKCGSGKKDALQGPLQGLCLSIMGHILPVSELIFTAGMDNLPPCLDLDL